MQEARTTITKTFGTREVQPKEEGKNKKRMRKWAWCKDKIKEMMMIMLITTVVSMFFYF